MGVQERRDREKEQRREAILDAAQEVFFEKGLLFSTMDEIAEKAEVSKGTLYLYYKSKEDLYLGVMMRGTKILEEEFQKIALSSASVLQKIILLGKAYIEFFHRYPNFIRMLHFSQLQYFHKQVSPEMRDYCSNQHRKLWNLAKDIFRQAITEGYVAPEFNPMELVVILWSSATALLLRLDNEKELWLKEMNIDLNHTLELSNSLLWKAMLTEKGLKEFATLQMTTSKVGTTREDEK